MFSITYLTGYLFSVLSFKSESSLIVQFGWGCEMGTGCTLGGVFLSEAAGISARDCYVQIQVCLGLSEGTSPLNFLPFIFLCTYAVKYTKCSPVLQDRWKAVLESAAPRLLSAFVWKGGYILSCLILLSISEPIQWFWIKLTEDALSASCVVAGK